MATNNSCNFSLGTISQVLTMLSSSTMGFANASNRSQSAASRSLNTVFQINSTRDSLSVYSVDIACTLSLSGGQNGTIFLEICPTSAFSTGIQELSRFSNANTGTLSLGLNIIQDITSTITGYVPAGYYVRLRTNNNSGTPTFTLTSGQETLL